MVKILLGGSPCVFWSVAKHGRETTPCGNGWELFKDFLIAKEKFQPDFFLYENNASIAEPVREKITEELGVKPQRLNSALVSAQNRRRLYWHNFGDIQPPADRGGCVRGHPRAGRGHCTEIQAPQKQDGRR